MSEDISEATLLKLRDNPHYKLSEKQKEALAKITRRPMVSFNVPPVHTSEVIKHEGLKRVKR